MWIPKVYDGHNKTFFFFNFDQFRNTSIVSGAAATVPTDAYRAGDFSSALTGKVLGTDPSGGDIVENAIYDPLSNTLINGQVVRTQFPGNIIPANRIDPVAAKIQALIPRPTNGNNTNNLAVVDQVASTTTLPSVKADHNIGEKNKISFFWTDWINNVPKSTGDGIPFPISNTRAFITHSNTERLTFDRTISPTFWCILGSAICAIPTSTRARISARITMRRVSLASSAASRTRKATLDFRASGLSAAQGGFNSPNGNSIGWTNGVYDWDDKPTATGSATWVKGNHTYKFGGEWHKDIWTFKNLVDSGPVNFSAAETAQPYLGSTSVGGVTIGFPIRQLSAWCGGLRDCKADQ